MTLFMQHLGKSFSSQDSTGDLAGSHILKGSVATPFSVSGSVEGRGITNFRAVALLAGFRLDYPPGPPGHNVAYKMVHVGVVNAQILDNAPTTHFEVPIFLQVCDENGLAVSRYEGFVVVLVVIDIP